MFSAMWKLRGARSHTSFLWAVCRWGWAVGLGVLLVVFGGAGVGWAGESTAAGDPANGQSGPNAFSRQAAPSEKPTPPPVPPAAPKPYAPTSEYERMNRQGWPVLVWKGFLRDHPELAEETLHLLDCQLFQIRRTLPTPVVEKLQKVRIWVEWEEGHHPCMAYHPSAAWLREHGMNPDKAKSVEIAHARNFLAWTKDQPWMVFHELAHAYHDQFLPGGYDNPEIKAVYQSALKGGLYQKVLFIQGGHRPAYAAKNPMEYFAELSEAYFGTNDMYPFVRGELREYDPAGFALLEKLWGTKSLRKPPTIPSPKNEGTSSHQAISSCHKPGPIGDTP